ncbi:BRO1-like domain-containing protein [Cladochytrium replicatum]|nr:BRO1-like domain-containing protein [Cladochytrium replicatum]
MMASSTLAFLAGGLAAQALPNSLAVDLKRTEKVPTLTPALKAYISSSYREEPDTYVDDFRALDEARGDIMKLDIHDASITKLLKYHGQLVYLSSKFPIDENHVKVCFYWHNVFGKDRRSVSSFNLDFERASVLFNLGAMYSQLAGMESRQTADGLKKACQYYQFSAGAFQGVLDMLAGDVRLPQTADLQTPTLSTLVNIMLAQAQECFWHRAILDKMKDGTVAKLAAKVAQYFDLAIEQATNSGAFLPTWLTQMQSKSAYAKADSHYRRSAEVLAATAKGGVNLFGEEIAWLQSANVNLKKLLEQPRNLSNQLQNDCKELSALVISNLQRAEKDNNLIYMEIVPRLDTLKPVDAIGMVKALPVPDLGGLKDVVGKPLFANLVPFAVHQMASVYSDRRDTFVKSEEERVQQATSACHSMLASLNLPGAIEALEQPVGLPPSLLKRADEVRALGGARALTNMLDTLRAMGAKDGEILDEALEVLGREEADDGAMRMQFQTRWTRPPSSELTANLRETAKVYRDKLRKAEQSDSLIQGKIEKHLPHIESLSATKEELEASIPASTAQSIPRNDPAVKKLKQLLEQLTQNIKQRTALVGEIKQFAKTDEIGPVLIQMTSNKVDIQQDKVFEEQLAKYDKWTGAITGLIKEQEAFLAAVMDANRQFSDSVKKNDMFKQREQALQNLDSAYKNFKDIHGNLEEGIKFYSAFQPVLNKFADNCRDFAFARNMDKKDYLAALQSSLSSLRLSESPMNPGTYPSSSNPSAPPPPAAAAAHNAYGVYSGAAPPSYGDAPPFNPPSSGQYQSRYS